MDDKLAALEARVSALEERVEEIAQTLVDEVNRIVAYINDDLRPGLAKAVTEVFFGGGGESEPEIMVCPVCNEEMEEDEEDWRCLACGHVEFSEPEE